MVYFSEKPVAPQSIDIDEYEKVKTFKKWCYERGIVQTFSNSDEFNRMFQNHLQININNNQYLNSVIENIQSIFDDTELVIEMSREARELLIAASLDSNGYILSVSTLGGRHIRVNGATFGEPGNARVSAKWESALDELIDLKYISPQGSKGEVFKITNAGYIRSDEFSRDNT